MNEENRPAMMSDEILGLIYGYTLMKRMSQDLWPEIMFPLIKLPDGAYDVTRETIQTYFSKITGKEMPMD